MRILRSLLGNAALERNLARVLYGEARPLDEVREVRVEERKIVERMAVRLPVPTMWNRSKRSVSG